jgi:hypothetical protein
MIREVSTPAAQTWSGVTYNFSSWSDGGAVTHEIAPTKSTTLTANFQPAP